MVIATPENAGRRVLITGGTGSFGSTVTRGLLDGPIDEIRILSRDEAKQDEMRRRLEDNRVRFYVGDVRDAGSVREAMDGVDYVFHAAALKQVPSCEFFPLQAVATNVHGSDNVIRAAHDCGVKSVVCLSTDKAVYPVNAMGLSKAMMERVAGAFARNHPESATTVSVTRYGNVMYSRGSVIPLFVEQVREGRPMTITNPGMTRFLMSLDESVALVQYAFENATPGDLFIRKAPASTIEDLAKAVALVMGVEPQIQVIGTRHGEKLYESLLSREEMAQAVDCGDYYRVPLDARSLDYGLYVEEGEHAVETEHDYTSHNTQRLSVEEVAELLAKLPEMREALAKVPR
ncbi:MAG: polysaccharide biosynthesis protein [Actinobacteria bacterium]|nr:polysaccharide biosynthesis protein [Actinomycetota bacterium]